MITSVHFYFMIKFVMDFNATTNSSDEFNSSQHLNAGKYAIQKLSSNLNVCQVIN